jgi:hypothetical protein
VIFLKLGQFVLNTGYLLTEKVMNVLNMTQDRLGHILGVFVGRWEIFHKNNLVTLIAIKIWLHSHDEYSEVSFLNGGLGGNFEPRRDMPRRQL